MASFVSLDALVSEIRKSGGGAVSPPPPPTERGLKPYTSTFVKGVINRSHGHWRALASGSWVKTQIQQVNKK